MGPTILLARIASPWLCKGVSDMLPGLYVLYCPEFGSNLRRLRILRQFNLKLTSYTLEFFYSKVTNFTFQLRGSHHHDGECILRLVVLVDLVRQHPTPGYVSKNTYRWTAISRLYHSNWVQYD